MKVLTKTPIPKVFRGHPTARGLLHEADVSIGSKLKLKLLVFESPSKLRLFWRRGLGKHDLGRDCLGAVNSLGYEVRTDRNVKHVYDPRYFAVMGLCAEHLGMEILTHEAVHAGISYAKRVACRNLWYDPADMDEEKLAYPIGRIARNVLLSLRKAKLLP